MNITILYSGKPFAIQKLDKELQFFSQKLEKNAHEIELLKIPYAGTNELEILKGIHFCNGLYIDNTHLLMLYDFPCCYVQHPNMYWILTEKVSHINYSLIKLPPTKIYIFSNLENFTALKRFDKSEIVHINSLKEISL